VRAPFLVVGTPTNLETCNDYAHEPQDRHVHAALFIERDRREVQAAGTYTVETNEKRLQGVSFPAYRRTETLIFLPARPGGAFVERGVKIDPLELEAAQKRESARHAMAGVARP
jgi:hypothetical protein